MSSSHQADDPRTEPARPPAHEPHDKPTAPTGRGRKLRIAIFVMAAIGLSFWATQGSAPSEAATRVPMSDVVRAVDEGRVERAEITAEAITVTLKGDEGQTGDKLVAERLPNIDETALLGAMSERGVTFEGQIERSAWWWTLFAGLLPFLILGALIFAMSGGAMAAAARNKPMSFGRSKAKLYDKSRDNAVTFDDVAGVDEAKAELTEIVDYLRDPGRYADVGARIPKGVLLVGPPGTGKTLLARAVAGESGVPFFSLSGSEFVEMFVGVGAARVRDLFEQAKERGPCIIFIDELDALGKMRSGGGGFVSNEEREQTLNQLLVEIDGFDSGAGLIVMAATNRPEILDKALLRAGRFDRQVVVDRPDVRGREAILRVHAGKLKLEPDVDLRLVAQRTPGMTGADLANVANEAALASVRRHASAVGSADFEEAVDRIQLGLKKEGRVMTADEKRRVAYHEAGHALVALSVEHADPVHRITIIPRTIGALGATLQLPTDERYLVTRGELLDQLCVLMGGRAAEDVIWRDVSTGAQNDLERATELARQMVTRFGMSDRIGPQTVGRAESLRFLATADGGADHALGNDTAQLVDAEVKAILEGAWKRAREILVRRRETLERLGRALLAKETLERDEVLATVDTLPFPAPDALPPPSLRHLERRSLC